MSPERATYSPRVPESSSNPLYRLGQGLLHEAVLARAKEDLGQLAVRGHGRGEHDGVEVWVAEQVGRVRVNRVPGKLPARARLGPR
jgi:hypothetical protein